MDFLYSLCLKCLYPTSLCAALLVAGLILHRNQRWSRRCFVAGLALLLICGNGWLISGMTRSLERRFPAPNPYPAVDAIVILAGGLEEKLYPRQTIEVAEAGDRLLFAAHLYREGKARRVICTGGTATGGKALRPAAEVMREFLLPLGVPPEAVIVEAGSANTHQHGQNLASIFSGMNVTNVLLVTSAMHMPRSMAVFRKQCPAIRFIPAPTDFRATDGLSKPWYRHLVAAIPTPKHLQSFCEVWHEFVGYWYYRLRGWL